MTEWLEKLVRRYRPKGLLLDANILLLLLVGTVDRELVQRFKRTSQFTAEDYDLLVGLLDRFKTLVTTPHILSEVNSLAGQLTDRFKVEFSSVFARGIESVLDEQNVRSADAARHTLFPAIGLTGAGIAHLVPGRYLVLTDDFELAGRLEALGADVVNFNHIRWMSWN